MSFNTFGHLFRVTTFGESHGPALGCVVDGCPPGIALTEADIQGDLDRRRPGQSKFVSQRKEPDQVRILSGVFKDERMKAQVRSHPVDHSPIVTAPAVVLDVLREAITAVRPKGDAS